MKQQDFPNCQVTIRFPLRHYSDHDYLLFEKSADFPMQKDTRNVYHG